MLAVAQRDIFFPANHCSLGMTLDQNNPSDKVCCISAFLVTTQEVNMAMPPFLLSAFICR